MNPTSSDSPFRSLSRRRWLGAAALAAAAGDNPSRADDAKAPTPAAAPSAAPRPPVRYCLNTSTVRGQKLPLDKQVELAAEAGYDGIEPWLRDLAEYREAGGSLRELSQTIKELGLTVDSAIGFAEWIVDDPGQRAKGLETARRDMELVRELGGVRIAAPPVGATREAGLDLFRAAERYRALLEVGVEMGVTPQLELWGFSKNLSRLGELMLVAVEAAHPAACLLPDIYHIYKGGSDFAGLRMINASKIHVFHMNDYPADPPRETIADADRVYCGRGVAPLPEILKDLWAGGFAGVLSLELFNREYWRQDPLAVARQGLESMRETVAAAEKLASPGP